jgi:glycosyltransferase involved in cell wall biosynthesis
MMTTDAVGGVWVFSVTLAQALRETGVEVLLATLGPAPADRQRRMLEQCRGISLLETDLKLEWQDPSARDLGRARDVLGGIADRFAPDLIHLNSFREAVFDWKAPCVVVAHSDVESWAAACGEEESFVTAEWQIYRSNIRAGLQSADAWVAPSKAYLDEVTRRYHPASKGHVISNGTAGVGQRVERKISVVLGAGRIWDKAKDMQVLSSVAVGLPWPVRIAGPRDIVQGGADTGPGDCEYLGEVAHARVLDEMQAAGIFVSPSLYEPFGLSVLEAANAGCALLLSDIPTFRELWNGAAMFFAAGDRDAFRQALRSLCEDEIKRAQLQRLAVQRAQAYTLQNSVSHYRALYASLVRGRRQLAASMVEMQA